MVLQIYYFKGLLKPMLQMKKPWPREVRREGARKQEGGGGVEPGLGHRKVMAQPCYTAPQLILEPPAFTSFLLAPGMTLRKPKWGHKPRKKGSGVEVQCYGRTQSSISLYIATSMEGWASGSGRKQGAVRV